MQRLQNAFLTRRREDCCLMRKAEAPSANDLFLNGIEQAKRRNWQEAAKHFDSALVLQRNALGMYHPDVARTLNEIGVVLTQMGESYTAMTALEEALFIRQETLGAGHEDVVETTNNMMQLFDKTREEMRETQRLSKQPSFTKRSRRDILAKQDSFASRSLKNILQKQRSFSALTA